jgi:two-component system response regulator NreC
MTASSSLHPIRIVIADDHLVVREGIKALLAGASDIRVVGEAADGREALAVIERTVPDVVLLDLDMPVVDGLTVLRTLVATRSPTRALVLTMLDDEEYLALLLEAGAAACLVKSVADRELVDAIRAVSAGDTYMRPTTQRALEARVARHAAHHDEQLRYASLSEREREVLVLIAEGHSATEIGERLLISPKTAETYKQRISEKLALHHRSEYVRFCLRLDLLQPHP